MNIVSIEEIPKETIDTPLKNLTELYSIAKKMELICVRNDGVGLSAVQVGIPWKFFIHTYGPDYKNFNYMIDCEYEPVSNEKFLSVEGCLSLKNSDSSFKRYEVERYSSIKVVGKQLIVGDKLSVESFEKIFEKSLECVVMQHEIDHHRNKLISDFGKEIRIQDVIRNLET